MVMVFGCKGDDTTTISSPLSSFAKSLLWIGMFLNFGRMKSSLAAAMSSSTSSTANKPAGALIFLHGLGDTPAGWSSLERQLPSIQPRLENIVYVFPHAPTIPISISGGMRMTGWFDLLDWPVSVGDPDDKVGQLKAVEQIEQEVHKLQTKYGIDRSNIVVGGFSQGGAIALLSAYYHANDKPFAGCAVLSGWLTLVNELKINDANKNVPCFWAHGKYDDKVLFKQQEFGVNKLKELGVSDVEPSSYPMGHESRPDELRNFATFLDKIIFDKQQQQESKEEQQQKSSSEL